jgi:hypothetical protein
MSYCKPCTLVRNAVRWQTNREKYKVKSKERYLANRAERLEHNKQRRKKLLEGGDQVLYAHIWNGEVMYVGMGDILRPYAFRERAADHKAMIKSSGEPKVVIVASSKDRGMIVTLEAFILWRLHQAGRLPKFNKSL